MGRSAMRDRELIPDFAALHPGYTRFLPSPPAGEGGEVARKRDEPGEGALHASPLTRLTADAVSATSPARGEVKITGSSLAMTT